MIIGFLKCYSKITCLALALALGGCVGMSSSPNPRFYALQAMSAAGKTAIPGVPPSVIVGIGPAKIPQYQDRPQIVTRGANNLVAFAEYDRWAEPLETALPRLVSANLSILLPGATIETSPWNMAIPVRYQVIMDVVRLDSRLDENLSLAVQWSVIDLRGNKVMFTKKSEFSAPIEPGNYSGLAGTLSVECASLSVEIAGQLSSLANRPEEAKDTPR